MCRSCQGSRKCMGWACCAAVARDPEQQRANPVSTHRHLYRDDAVSLGMGPDQDLVTCTRTDPCWCQQKGCTARGAAASYALGGPEEWAWWGSPTLSTSAVIGKGPRGATGPWSQWLRKHTPPHRFLPPQGVPLLLLTSLLTCFHAQVCVKTCHWQNLDSWSLYRVVHGGIC